MRYGNMDIGYVDVLWYKDYAYIYLLWIEEKYRRKHHGTKIMKEAIEIILEKRNLIKLHVNRWNTEARTLYANLGFVVVDDYTMELRK
jgi:ribosomal protein S18 acetylase RimI-like enzyme